MSRKKIKLSSLTAIAKGLTADPVNYMIIDVEMNNPADFDRNMLQSLETIDANAGKHVQTGVVNFHLPGGNDVHAVMNVDDVRRVLKGQIRYNDFIANHTTIL